MKRILSIMLVSAFSLAFASHFTGTYQDQQRGITLIIQHSTNAQMQGMMIQGGVQLQLQGQGNEQGAQGVLTSPQGQLGFQAQLSPDGAALQLTLQPSGPQGQPQQLSLRRVSYDAKLPGEAPGPRPPVPGPPGPQPPRPQPPMPQPPTPQPPLPQPPSPDWSGLYTGNAGQLTVVIQPAAPGSYQGYIELSGTRYPLQARGDASYLEGSFQSPNGSFEFALEQSSGTINLYSGDTQYILERQNTPIGPGSSPSDGANPLGDF